MEKNCGGEGNRKDMRDMQALDARKNGATDAGPDAGELPPSAALDVPAGAEHLQAARAGEQQGRECSREVAITFPCETVSGMNVREHWAVKAKRAKKHRGETYLQLRCAALSHQVPCTVMLTRIAPRALDGDNLQASLKNIRDGVADWLKVDDRDPRITWVYGQRKGNPKQYAVEVKVS